MPEERRDPHPALRIPLSGTNIDVISPTHDHVELFLAMAFTMPPCVSDVHHHARLTAVRGLETHVLCTKISQRPTERCWVSAPYDNLGVAKSRVEPELRLNTDGDATAQ